MEVKIKRLSEYDDSENCVLPIGVFQELKLSTNKLYNIHFGQLSEPLRITFTEEEENCICIPEDTFQRLLLQDNITVNIWSQNKDIFLGPVVGIFETPRFLENIMKGNATYYEKQNMLASVVEGCFSYYFTLENIDWLERKIRGVTYISSLDIWEQHWFSMPNIIYDEGVFLAKSIKDTAKQIRRQFRTDSNICYINNRNGFGKWELYERLSKYEVMKKFLPETILFTKFEDITSMLNKYGYIFVKSFYGSKGYEVLSIEEENQQYRINYYDDEVKEKFLKDLNDVEEFVNYFTEGKKYIVQQGIKFIKYKGHNMDLRVLIQKDESGEWQSIFNLAKIARGNTTITNHAAGGDAAVYQQIYPYLSSPMSNVRIPTNSMIVNRTIKIASYIEKEFGPFGDIGMDMAIDINGKVWLIEANAKPDKVFGLEVLDIYGESLAKALTKNNDNWNGNPKFRFDNLDEPLPQVLSIFKYAKFLATNHKYQY